MFLFLPGIALADSEPVTVEPVKTEAAVTVQPETNKLELTKVIAEALPAIKPETEVKKEVPPAPKPPEPVVHEVQSGDTLTAIGESHQTPWTRVYDANAEVADPNVIMPGQKLRIPRADETIAPRTPAAPPAPPAPVAAAPAPVASAGPVQTRVDSVHTVSANPELIGSYGAVLVGGNCVNTAKAHGKNQPGNPISWSPTTQTPFVGAAALFYFNHVAIVTGIHSDGSIEVIHENCPGCPTHYPRGTFRGFF